jgi:hypothetical protein
MSVIPPRADPNRLDAPAQPGPTPELGETLKVVNVGNQTLRFAWNSRQYVIPPGASDFMPFDAIKVYVGDPRATNNVRTSRDSIGIISFLPDRATEVRRLRLLYSAPFGEYMRASDVGGIFVNTPADPNPADMTQQFAWDGVRIPQVEIYNIRGERIYTVLDDPEGVLSIPVSITQQHVDRSEQLERLVEQQGSLIQALSQRLGIDPNSPALDNAPDLLNEIPPDVETHEDGTPVMVLDQNENQVKVKRHRPPSEPSSLNDLPEDKI